MSATSCTAMRASQRSGPGGRVRRAGMQATSAPRPVIQHASTSRRVCTSASRPSEVALASSPLLHNAISRRYRRSLLWGALGAASLALSLVAPKPAEARQVEDDMFIISTTEASAAGAAPAKYEDVAFAAGVPPQAAREEAEEVVQEVVEKMKQQKQRTDQQQQRNKVEHKTN